jgi:hypothetical protein
MGKKSNKQEPVKVKEPVVVSSPEADNDESVPSELASDDSQENGKLGYDSEQGESDMDLDDELVGPDGDGDDYDDEEEEKEDE